MPACKDKYNKWCKDEKTVYTDEAGMEYCVFHAPKGKKGVSLEAFNEMIFERIDNAISEKQSCELSGTAFEGVNSLQKPVGA